MKRKKVEFQTQPRQLYTIKEACKLLGVGAKRLAPFPPTNTLDGSQRRYYSPADLKRISVELALGQRNVHQERREAGYWSVMDVVRAVGLSQASYVFWNKKGVIPAPTHTYPGCIGLYYIQREAKPILAFFAKRAKSYHKWVSSQRTYGWEKVKPIKV